MNENARIAYSFFKQRGYTDAQAAGIVGNLLAESSMRTGARNPGDGRDGSDSIGIAQWNSDRARGLKRFAAEKGRDPFDLVTQLEYIDHELNTSERRAKVNLLKAQTPQEAATAFIGFERPAGFTWDNPTAGHNHSGRVKYSADLFNRLSGQPPVDLASVTSQAPGRRVGFSELSPQAPVTDVERNRIEAAKREDSVGFFSGVAQANWDASPINWLFNGNNDMAPDAGFSFRQNKALLDELTATIPQEHWEALSEAHSEAHARSIAARVKAQVDQQQRFANAGWTGTAAMLIGELTEPVGLAAAIFTPSAALPAKLGRAGRIGVRALEAGVANAALELPRYLNKETASGADLLWAAGSGIALGGAFGALSRNPALAEEAAGLEKIGKSLMREAQGSTTPFVGGSVGAARLSIREDLSPELHAWFDVSAPETALGKARFDSVGQLKSSKNPIARALGDLLGVDGVGNKDKDIALSFTASEYTRKVHEGMMTQAMKAYTPELKKYLDRLGVGFGGRKVAERDFRSKITNFIRNEDPTVEFDPEVAAVGTRLRELQAKWVDLLTDPGKVSGQSLRPVPGFENLETNPNYIMRVTDHAKLAENTVRFGDAQLRGVIANAVRAAQPGISSEIADKIGAGYLKRIRSLAAGVDTKGDLAVSGASREAMEEVMNDIGTLTSDEIQSVLNAFTKKPSEGAHARAKRRTLFSENYTEKLVISDRNDPRFGETVDFRIADLFHDDAMGLFEAYSRQMSGLIGMHHVRVKNPRFTPDHVPPSKRPGVEVIEGKTPIVRTANGDVTMRVDGDRMVVDGINATDPNHVRELMEAAADYAATNGKRLASGPTADKAVQDAFGSLKGDWKVKHAPGKMSTAKKHAAAGVLVRKDGNPVYEVGGSWKAPSDEPEMLIDGLARQSEWDAAKVRMKQMWDSLDPTAQGAMKLDEDNLEFLRRGVMGVTDPFDQTNWGKGLRMIRDYNFIRLMNQVGFAQLAEAGIIVSSVGLKAALRNMPTFRSLVRSAKNMELDDALAREIEAVSGYGTDWLRGGLRTTMDDMGNPMNFTGHSKTLNTVDDLLQQGKRVTTAISGMAPVNTFLQRWAGRAVFNKFANMAGGEAANLQRLRYMGVSDEMAPRIFAQIRKNGSFVDGEVSGSKLRRMNIEKWDDAEAAATFEMAVHRWVRYAVMENDVGLMSRVMDKPMAKIIVQFRTFVLGAWTKHTLHNIHMRDPQAAMALILTTAAGAMSYVAQTHLASIGRSDRQEFLERRLAWDRLVFGSLQRSSLTSLIPMMVDTGTSVAGFDPVFDARTTGLPSDSLFGNPTVGLFNEAVKGAGGLLGTLHGNPFSQPDARSAMRVMPFANFLPVTWTLNTMIQGLPEFEPRNRN